MFRGVVWQGCIGPQLLVSNANERSTFDFTSDVVRDVFSFLVIRQQVILSFDLLKDFCKHPWHQIFSEQHTYGEMGVTIKGRNDHIDD